MNPTVAYIGEASALSTAVMWALAVILFKKSGETVHPIALNAFKNLLALVLFIPTMWLLGESLLRPVPAGDYLLMMASGALGIGLADTMFFRSLNLLGAGLSAIVDCLYSPFVIGLSIWWLSERLDVWQVVGVLMIIAAVLTVTREKGAGAISAHNLVRGIFWGVAAMALMAVGIVMIRPLLERSPLIWSTEVRLTGGCLMLGLMLLAHTRRGRVVRSLCLSNTWRYTIPGSFVGAYLAMVTWLAGMKFTQMSVAAALNQTSNIFIFVFAALFLREAINARRIAGIAMAVVGVFMVTFL